MSVDFVDLTEESAETLNKLEYYVIELQKLVFHQVSV